MRRPTAVETFCMLGVVVIGVGCKQRAPEPAPPVAVVAKAATTQTNDTGLEKALCGERSPCQLKHVWNAGTDEAGRAMRVVKLSLNPGRQQRSEPMNDGADEVTESGGDTCEPFEYWFVRPALLDADSPDAKPALLLAVCNDGYGMADMGVDTITVRPGRFVHFQSGGSAAMWNTARVVELPSLQLIETNDGSWHRTLPESNDSAWSWTEFAGTVSGYNPGCDEDADVGRETIDAGNFAYEPVLQPSIADAYRKDGWKNASLGSCGTRATSAGASRPTPSHSGFVIHGTPGAESDASFKVVMASDAEMFVEVTDDVWVEEADSILHADHLELWASTGPVCPKPVGNLFQWGITLDGAVRTLYGKSAQSPRAEAVRVNENGKLQSVRFKITLPEPYSSVTVVYSDSDDGKTQKRLIATSALKHRDQFTLGETKVIDAQDGRCEVQDGALNFIRTPPTPRSPVLGHEG